MGPILNTSFYRFVGLSDLPKLRDRLKSRAVSAGLRGTILLSEEGINGFLAGEPERLRPYLEWLFTDHPEFRGMVAKESYSADIPFTRMLVRIKREIISMGRPEVKPSEKTGKGILPIELKRWYDEDKNFVIVDTRNDYEISQGTFKNAIHYDIENFRQFPKQLEAQAEQLKDKTVVMFFTGGIRCEKATALAMDLGIQDVYQLEGGILKYFEEVGGTHYQGECFVFDHRGAVDAGLEALPEKKRREKMAAIRLTYSPGSPIATRVIMALESKGLKFERNAKSDVDGVLLENGSKRFDDCAQIFTYLNEEFREARPLIPTDPERRARMDLWLNWIDSAFTNDSKQWIEERSKLSPEESHALEVRLEKHLYRLKTPMQKNRNFLVVNDLTEADLAAYSVLEPLLKNDFPRDFPERFQLVYDWANRVAETVREGLNPKPKVLRRVAAWPN
jgi:UPF0176 protein